MPQLLRLQFANSAFIFLSASYYLALLSALTGREMHDVFALVIVGLVVIIMMLNAA